MNLFKKALVASAVVASFGVAAEATISSTPLAMSAEGVADGITAANQNFSFDVVVGTLHPAASTITLTFDANVDLDALTGGAVTNTPSNGTGTAGDITFDYGTGSFTFDNVVIDTTTDGAHTIAFDINLGNPLTADSAFRISIGGATVDISGASTVAYDAVTSGGDAIESGAGVIAEETSQFAFVNSLAFDQLITRDNTLLFTDSTDVDSAQFVLTNNESLAAAMTAVTGVLTVDGDFTGVVAADLDAEAEGVDLVAVEVVNGDDEIVLTLSAAEVVNAATTTIDLGFDEADGTALPVTGDVTATMQLDYTNGTSTAFNLPSVDAGEWALDATVINVPYFPVGFEGTSTSVHFANESAADADVIVTAIDDEGNTYGPLDLGSDFAAETVTKVSQGAIMSLFGLTDSTKLSVTFNIDADDGDVNAYAFTTDDTGRTEISNSQLKGIE
jgi:hypothetical protein